MPRRKKEVPLPEEKAPDEQSAAAGESPAEPVEPAAEPAAEPGPEAAVKPPPPEPPLPPSPAAGPPPARPGLTSEERWAAAIAHGSILLNLVTGIGGPVLALVIWLLYERKSRYVAWHALQALVFQSLTIVLLLAMGAVAGVLWALAIPLMAVAIGCCLAPFALGFTAIAAALVIGSLFYGCAAGLTVLEGRDFRYRWVADWIPPPGEP